MVPDVGVHNFEMLPQGRSRIELLATSLSTARMHHGFRVRVQVLFKVVLLPVGPTADGARKFPTLDAVQRNVHRVLGVRDKLSTNVARQLATIADVFIGLQLGWFAGWILLQLDIQL